MQPGGAGMTESDFGDALEQGEALQLLQGLHRPQGDSTLQEHAVMASERHRFPGFRFPDPAGPGPPAIRPPDT